MLKILFENRKIRSQHYEKMVKIKNIHCRKHWKEKTNIRNGINLKINFGRENYYQNSKE